jgi:hypothetical protein
MKTGGKHSMMRRTPMDGPCDRTGLTPFRCTDRIGYCTHCLPAATSRKGGPVRVRSVGRAKGLGVWFPVIAAWVLFLSIAFVAGAYAQTKDACVDCHTDAAKMKLLITKFPEVHAEEGEG